MDGMEEMAGLDDHAHTALPPLETIPYRLPSGHVIECLGQAEYKLCEDTAKPYLEVGAQIPEEAWLHIKSLLDLVVLRERRVAQTRHPLFHELDIKSQKEIYQGVTSLTSEITSFAQRLDPLKQARGDDGMTPAEWRIDVMAKALTYAQTRLGEFTWMALCPDPRCKFNEQPFYMILETPHFAMDPAAGPAVIWNEECAELVHRHYCQTADCHHPSHRKYTGSLTVADAARILRISPIGLLALAWEKEYDLGMMDEIDLDQPDTLKPYIL